MRITYEEFCITFSSSMTEIKIIYVHTRKTQKARRVYVFLLLLL